VYLVLAVPDRYDSTGQDLTLTGHGHDEMVTVSIKWINVKANLVLSCLGLFPVSLPVLLCSTVQYSYRNEAASFKVQGDGKNEREQKSKEKNKKKRDRDKVHQYDK
jgi:hypothetical protein